MPRRNLPGLALLGIVGITAIAGIPFPSNAQGEPKQRTVPTEIPPRPLSIASSKDSSDTDSMRFAVLQLRAADRMESRNRLLQSDAESSIAEHAARLGYALAWATGHISRSRALHFQAIFFCSTRAERPREMGLNSLCPFLAVMRGVYGSSPS